MVCIPCNYNAYYSKLQVNYMHHTTIAIGIYVHVYICYVFKLLACKLATYVYVTIKLINFIQVLLLRNSDYTVIQEDFV